MGHSVVKGWGRVLGGMRLLRQTPKARGSVGCGDMEAGSVGRWMVGPYRYMGQSTGAQVRLLGMGVHMEHGGSHEVMNPPLWVLWIGGCSGGHICRGYSGGLAWQCVGSKLQV